MGLKRFACWVVCCCCATGLALSAAGCGSTATVGTAPVAALSENLPWPPPAVHLASETNFNFNGNEWLQKSSTATDAGSSLSLAGGGGLAWAIYGVDHLSASNELLQVSVTYAQAPLEPGDGTQLYIGLANFDLDSWEWLVPATSPWEHDITASAGYRSSGGNGYLAVALAGPGTATVDAVSFTSAGDFVGIPQNLTAQTIAVELVQLDWDAVASATGYNIYRSISPDMSATMKLNDTPVTENAFEDEFIDLGDFLRNRYLYYQVTAVGAVESDPSNIARTWSFGVDLVAPQNFRVVQKAATEIRVGWDWEGAKPSGGYRVYISTEPDFHIDGNTIKQDLSSYSETFNLTGCESEVYYYFKMCAKTSDNLGRLTDEISDKPADFWDWSDVKVIATGETPLRAAKIDAGEIAVAYFNDISVDVSTSSSGVWSADNALPGTEETRIYSNYMDFAYANGVYLAGAWDARAGDAWVAHGEPGSWTRTRIHGDGGTGLLHPESGLFIICTANDTELSVAHLYNRTDPNLSEIILHNKPSTGGTWSQTVIRSINRDEILYPLQPAHNLAYFSDDLYYLGNDGGEVGLFFTSRNGGWDFATTDIRDGEYRFRKYLDLTRFNGEWYTTAYDSINNKLYLLDEEAPLPWNVQELTPAKFTGYYARMDAEGSEAVIIYKSGDYFQFARYSKDWSPEPIIIPGVSDFSNSVDLLLIGGEPFFIFGDDDTGQIKIARGVPPVE